MASNYRSVSDYARGLPKYPRGSRVAPWHPYATIGTRYGYPYASGFHGLGEDGDASTLPDPVADPAMADPAPTTGAARYGAPDLSDPAFIGPPSPPTGSFLSSKPIKYAAAGVGAYILFKMLFGRKKGRR